MSGLVVIFIPLDTFRHLLKKKKKKACQKEKSRLLLIKSTALIVVAVTSLADKTFVGVENISMVTASSTYQTCHFYIGFYRNRKIASLSHSLLCLSQSWLFYNGL